jgi:hypothetical protein
MASFLSFDIMPASKPAKKKKIAKQLNQVFLLLFFNFT